MVDRLPLTNTPATHTPSDFLPDFADWTGNGDDTWYGSAAEEDAALEEMDLAASKIQAVRRGRSARLEAAQLKTGDRMVPSAPFHVDLVKCAPLAPLPLPTRGKKNRKL